MLGVLFVVVVVETEVVVMLLVVVVVDIEIRGMISVVVVRDDELMDVLGVVAVVEVEPTAGTTTVVVETDALGGDEEVDTALGATTTVAVFTHPISLQTFPGMQHPPPGLFGQGVSPDGHSEGDESPQVSPLGQQPTVPNPVSCTVTHVSSVAQQISGAPIAVHAAVPLGQL